MQGRGFPDLASRRLLRAIETQFGAALPLLALVDFDPSGVSIFLTYKTGGRRNLRAHENLNVESLRWVGAAQLYQLSFDLPLGLPLSLRDRKLLVSLLLQPLSPSSPSSSPIRDHLQRMLRSGKKAEIEALFHESATPENTTLRSILDDSFLWI